MVVLRRFTLEVFRVTLPYTWPRVWSPALSTGVPMARTSMAAELVTMINRAYGYTRKAGVPFTDVPSSKWYADDIEPVRTAGAPVRIVGACIATGPSAWAARRAGG